MFGLSPTGISAQATLGPQGSKVFGTAGQNFVNVGLVTGVPHDRVTGRVERAVQSNREFHGAKVRAQVSPGGRNSIN
ncbi:unannotated protein [freshwater metagenome]|uniref:Unannotated protein n=1 Tax=freshwater metagenome TaxID=449393 RepID=A0A6J6IGQ8_9ZZZZ